MQAFLAPAAAILAPQPGGSACKAGQKPAKRRQQAAAGRFNSPV